MSDAVDLIAAVGGEIITYVPHNGTPKQFKAIVHRQPSQVQQSQAGPYAVNQLEVLIPMDAVDGVMSVQVRKDTMQFKKNLSDSEVSLFTVQKILEEDAGLGPGTGGMFRVLVQA